MFIITSRTFAQQAKYDSIAKNDALIMEILKPEAPAADWESIQLELTKKYGAIEAENVVATAKVSYYKSKENWPEYSKSLIAFANNQGKTDKYDQMNNYAWEIFLHSNDKSQLEIALTWSKKAIEDEKKLNICVCIDTYANLLYKLDKKEDAIAMEEKALQIARDNKSEDYIPDMVNTLEKMKSGKPTWD